MIKIIHVITEIILNPQLITKYASINVDKAFTVYPNTLLVFKYLCN